MPADISPKVLGPACALSCLGGCATALGIATSDDRLRQVGATMLGASLLVAAVGWASLDPQREPYIEPGFLEPDPEIAEHRTREQTS